VPSANTTVFVVILGAFFSFQLADLIETTVTQGPQQPHRPHLVLWFGSCHKNMTEDEK
jgi:hypothetical protein